MFNSIIKWYSKKDVLNVLSISERTYFRKLKEIGNDVRIKIVKSKRGKDSKLIYFKDLNEVFCLKRNPTKTKKELLTLKDISTPVWSYIGNIVPEKSYTKDLEYKMKYIHKLLKNHDSDSMLYYSVEPNTKDSYFHSHFLIKSNIVRNDLYEILTLVCEENTKRMKRIYIDEYDYNLYNNRGLSYSSKKINFKNSTYSVTSELLV